MNKTVLFCGFHQETASFNPVPSTEENYRKFVCEWEGEAMLRRFRGSKTPMGGLMAAVEEAGFTARGSAYLRAYSGGPVQQELVDRFLDCVRRDLAEIGPVAGVMVALHGATHSEASEDVSGDVLTAIRAMVGEDAVIAAPADLHANVTERMMRAADFISGYHTYPHLDTYETGYRAASLAVRKLQGERVHMAWTTLPQMAPASGYTTEAGGLKKLMDRGHALTAEGLGRPQREATRRSESPLERKKARSRSGKVEPSRGGEGGGVSPYKRKEGSAPVALQNAAKLEARIFSGC